MKENKERALYFIYIKNEVDAIVERYITTSEEKARQYCDQYKQTEGACCVLEYIISKQTKQGATRLAHYYA